MLARNVRFIKLSILMLLTPVCVWAQNTGKKKIDLDDLMIKGEVHSDDRLLMLSRQKNELKNYIKFRTNYRQEILQEYQDFASKTKINNFEK